jgi:hypothetical protein
MDSTDAPAAAATLLWSTSVSALLKKSKGACSRASCYVHIAVAAEGHAGQEATVWLAPFKDLRLQDPRLTVQGFKAVGYDQEPGSPSRLGRQQEAVAFTVSSQAVAAFVVWEMQAGALQWHFDTNAVTVHPCEPREVLFYPRGSTRAGLLHEGHTGPGNPAGETPGSGTAGSSHAESASVGAAGADTVNDRGASSGQRAAVLQAQRVLRVLEEQLLVTSLWEHQQFDVLGNQQPVHEALISF